MKRYRIAFWLAVVTTATTFCLISLGGYVFNTGSSLACPDWPKCYGEWMPKMTGGVLYEHSHRMLGALVGLFSLLIGALLWKREPGAPSLRGMGAALPLLVIFQGVLGGIVVIYKLPQLARVGHLATSMVVLMVLLMICRATWLRSRAAEPGAPALAAVPGIRIAFALLLGTAMLVYLQLLLGAAVRHTASSEAAGWGLAWSMIGQDPLTGRAALWPASGPARLNLAHRYAALGVATAVILCCAGCWGMLRERPEARWRRWLWLPAALVLLQILVGVTMLATWNLKVTHPGLEISNLTAMHLQAGMRTLHLAVGALVLASLWVLAVTAGEAQVYSFRKSPGPGLDMESGGQKLAHGA